MTRSVLINIDIGIKYGRILVQNYVILSVLEQKGNKRLYMNSLLCFTNQKYNSKFHSFTSAGVRHKLQLDRPKHSSVVSYMLNRIHRLEIQGYNRNYKISVLGILNKVKHLITQISINALYLGTRYADITKTTR